MGSASLACVATVIEHVGATVTSSINGRISQRHRQPRPILPILLLRFGNISMEIMFGVEMKNAPKNEISLNPCCLFVSGKLAWRILLYCVQVLLLKVENFREREIPFNFGGEHF